MSRAQSRAKSGMPDAVNGDTKAEEIEPVSFSGRAQAITAGARNENWY
ncbi:MAG: hypothetical protein ABSG80_16555 [Verrucomicrobiota bacterium]|jgi:hypothetical protein